MGLYWTGDPQDFKRQLKDYADEKALRNLEAIDRYYAEAWEAECAKAKQEYATLVGIDLPDPAQPFVLTAFDRVFLQTLGIAAD